MGTCWLQVRLGQAPGAATPHLTHHPAYSAFCSSCPSIYTYTICIMYQLGLDPMGKSAACPWLCREAGAAPGPCSCMQLGTVTSGQAAAGEHHTRGVSLSPGCYYLSMRVLNVSTLLLKWKKIIRGSLK